MLKVLLSLPAVVVVAGLSSSAAGQHAPQVPPFSLAWVTPAQSTQPQATPAQPTQPSTQAAAPVTLSQEDLEEDSPAGRAGQRLGQSGPGRPPAL